MTTTAVQNGVPNNVTTKIRADYSSGVGDNITESQTGGTFASVEEITTRDVIYRPGAAFGATWTRQARVPAPPGMYETPDFIPMVDDIIDQPLREAMEPTASKTEVVDGVTMTSLTYVIDRARVPEIATAIYARVPWLFDVPNATTLTVDVTYDESGVVRHLHFGVEPPQPGTGSDATWITGYTLDVTSLNAAVAIDVPVDALEVPPGTP